MRGEGQRRDGTGREMAAKNYIGGKRNLGKGALHRVGRSRLETGENFLYFAQKFRLLSRAGARENEKSLQRNFSDVFVQLFFGGVGVKSMYRTVPKREREKEYYCPDPVFFQRTRT